MNLFANCVKPEGRNLQFVGLCVLHGDHYAAILNLHPTKGNQQPATRIFATA
jgi:hypothetical protein